MTDRTRKEHPMKRLAVTLAVVAGALGVVPTMASGANRVELVKPALAKQQVVRQQVVKSAIVRPAVVKTAVFRTAVFRTALWRGQSLQVVRVHGL
jgi:hypothetical protein